MTERVLHAVRAAMTGEPEGGATSEHLRLINEVVKPLKDLTADDVYVRGMVVCNDQVDKYSTRFTREALDEIAAMLPGVPMMRNHGTYQTSDMPVSRVFKAWVADSGSGGGEVRALFYALKGDAEAESLIHRIDGGVQGEVSISWAMDSFKCSLDGAELSKCQHWPGEVYAEGVCVGVMSAIREVYEVSHVWLGGQNDTGYFMAASKQATDVRALLADARRGEAPEDPWDGWEAMDPWREWREAG